MNKERINLEDILNFVLQVFSVLVVFTNRVLINTNYKNHLNNNILNEINIVLIINKETNLCCVLGMHQFVNIKDSIGSTKITTINRRSGELEFVIFLTQKFRLCCKE